MLLIATLLVLAVSPLRGQDSRPGQDPPSGDAWERSLPDRSQRGTLQDRFQHVRGDSGKWSEEPQMLLAPPVGQKPEKMALDDWFDQLQQQRPQPAEDRDSWLLLRTRQLDDNDRVWVEQVQRRGNQFTIVVREAIWEGRYNKTFTYYGVFGFNLGQLPPGKYQATWIIEPVKFRKFAGDGRPRGNWPQDDRPADARPNRLSQPFTVVAK